MNAYANYPLLVGQQTNLYKCVLTNTFDLASVENGYIGILCPESIYDDPKGQPLRRELYKRLRYHFQYQNELRLFAEVHHHTVYGDQLLGPRRSSSPRFASLSNLFHPNTVDACFAHDGHGECGGIKDKNGNKFVDPSDRLIQVDASPGQFVLELLVKCTQVLHHLNLLFDIHMGKFFNSFADIIAHGLVGNGFFLQIQQFIGGKP